MREQIEKSMDSKVQVLESSFVAPNEPAPVKGQGLWLSSLDLKNANLGRTPIFYLYRSNDAAAPDFFDVPRLKEALAKALAVFYPLAGRLSVDKDGRMEISCNDEGALFVVARADLTVHDIKNLEATPELSRLVLPRVDQVSIILAVQVTFLKCGGVALGAALHKTCVDGTSGFHFMQTWSAFSKHGDRATVELPSHDRTLLRARSPPSPHPDAPLTFYTKGPFADPLGPVATKVLTISKDQVASLKHTCGVTSTFCAVSALVWKCTCIARRLPSDTEALLTFSANIRHRVRPPLPSRYFGNAVLRLGVTSTMRDIAMEALGSIASRIKGTIDRIDDELVRSAVDYYEMTVMGNPQPLRGTLPHTQLSIVSWLGMPLYEADFGWGKPQLMSRVESIHRGFVHLMNNEGTGDDGGVHVVVCLEAAYLMELERLLSEDRIGRVAPRL